MGSEIVSLHMQQDVKRQSVKRMHKRLNEPEKKCSVPATVAISELKTPQNIPLTVVTDCSHSDEGVGGGAGGGGTSALRNTEQHSSQ